MIELTQNPDPPLITHCKIVAMKMEDNVEHWVKCWLIFGYLDGADFVEWQGVQSMITPLELHFEDGIHPLDSTRGLRQCPTCEEWYTIETECPDCQVATDPYDAFSRLVGAAPQGGQSCCTGMVCAIYNLAVTDKVPDLVTGTVRPLIDGAYAP